MGVCAYNEEKSITSSLQNISSQRQEGFQLLEVVVVSSGSTDRTDELVTDYQRLDSRINFFRQKHREGKNSAVNLFMTEAKGDVLVLVNADNILSLDPCQSW